MNINEMLNICQEFSKTCAIKDKSSDYKHNCHCDDKYTVIDEIHGDVICTNCGLVKDEYIRMHSINFDKNENIVLNENAKDIFFEQKTMSTFISKKFTKHHMSNLAQKIHMQTSYNAKQSNRYKDFDIIERLCNDLKTTTNISTDAKKFFHDLCQIKIFRGKNRRAMMICCILHSFTKNKCDRDLYELSKTQNIDKPTLTKNIKIYESMVNVKIIQDNNKCQEVYRYLQGLNISDKDIFKMSNDIISKRKKMLQMNEYQGRNPKTLMAIILHNDYGFDKKNIRKVLNVSITAY